MGKTKGKLHNANSLRAYLAMAESVRRDLELASDGLDSLASRGITSIHIEKSGSIDKAMKNAMRFGHDAFAALQNAVTNANSESDTARRGVTTSVQKRPGRSDTPASGKKPKPEAK